MKNKFKGFKEGMQPFVEVRGEKDSLKWTLVLNPELRAVLWGAYGNESDAWLGTRIRVTLSYKTIKSGKNKGQRKPMRVLEILEMAPRTSKPRDLVEPVPPSDATTTVQPSTSGATLKPVKARVRSEEATWLKDTWNRIVTDPLPKVQRLSPQRIRTCEIAIKEYGLDALTSACQAVEKSAFCRGSGNRGWVATFDWLIRADHCLKVLEGPMTPSPRRRRRSRAAPTA